MVACLCRGILVFKSASRSAFEVSFTRRTVSSSPPFAVLFHWNGLARRETDGLVARQLLGGEGSMDRRSTRGHLERRNSFGIPKELSLSLERQEALKNRCF